MEKYDNRGQAALWKKKDGASEKAPAFKGTVVIPFDCKEGDELDLSFWKNENENPNAPILKGKMAKKYVKSATSDEIAF